MKRISTSGILNLSALTSDARREGFVVLFGSAPNNENRLTMVGMNPVAKMTSWKQLEQKAATTLVGYLAYPNVRIRNTIPSMRFYAFDAVRCYNRFSTTSVLLLNTYSTSGRLSQSVAKLQYVRNIQKIQLLLMRGEAYQINYSIRFTKQFEGDPYGLFLKLSQTNPANFSAFTNCGAFQIISCSPERLVSVENGRITAQPIKGTIAKGSTPGARERSKKALLSSQKDRAELDMITDLQRNDLGRICEFGSVKVSKERSLLELKNMWHTYSEITGRVRKDVELKEIMGAVFPGGSVTGCPKIRAMQHIEDLEQLPRNIFTGSIGYINNLGSRSMSADFNIAIRTILIQNGQLEFWVGGGIVADSIPEREYEECLLKAQKIIEVL